MTYFIIDAAIIVAVVVPSPAYVLVLCATRLIKEAPSSFGLANLIIIITYETDFATVTPSFVILGIPIS